MAAPTKIGAVIPCYRVSKQILDVLDRVPPIVERIFVVDDGCPEGTGDLVAAEAHDARVCLLRHDANQGVGAATVTGYRAALQAGMDIIVKVDGDGQMAPELIGDFVRPIEEGLCDYVKGNRFFRTEMARSMPAARLIGNAALSFLTKFSSGYWQIVDPTNGYTAVHAGVLRLLPLDALSADYFFESDMLYQLGTVDAVVCDLPMHAHYGDETSSLKIGHALGRFLVGHVRNGVRRLVYCHFIRSFGLASLQLLLALPLLVFSVSFGLTHWARSIVDGAPATAGTVMLAALPGIFGVQLLLSFLGFDMSRTRGRVPRQRLLSAMGRSTGCPLGAAEIKRPARL